MHVARYCTGSRGRCWRRVPSVTACVVIVAVVGGACGKDCCRCRHWRCALDRRWCGMFSIAARVVVKVVVVVVVVGVGCGRVDGPFAEGERSRGCWQGALHHLPMQPVSSSLSLSSSSIMIIVIIIIPGTLG
ncbi:hypothetical protein EDB83DRAFT_2352475 [Lactarius deliciosus]|nr:hypothetical protein EDB83DRAFT_2352475 [Lactarius deliciosus]